MAIVNTTVLDPNEAASPLPNYVNGTPEYEKMFIFAELIGRRRGRTTLVRSGFGTSQQFEGLENDISINMMGFDQETKEYTTRYSRNTSMSKSVYEGFGITNIDVKINASYVPQVIIDFVDVRGMAFANQGTESPYSILIDFPPAIFTLTLKGYYGRSLTYNLHLTKNSFTFDSNNGNYNITSEFIASTYAPLSDVPFKYIEMFPLTDYGTARPAETTLNPDGTKDVSNIPDTIANDIKQPPKNTYELVKNTQKLYDSLSELKETSEVSRQYDESLEAINAANMFAIKMANFSRYLGNIDIENGAIMAIVDNSLDTGSTQYFRTINSLIEYNTTITSAEEDGVKPTFPKRLFLLVLRRTIKEGNLLVETPKRDSDISTALEKLRKELLNDGNNIDQNISKNDNSKDILNVKTPNNQYTPILISKVDLENPNNVVEYFGLDVTVIYQKVYKKWNERKLSSTDKREEFIDEINNLAVSKLGLKPSIYNIFKILCDDIDTFFEKIRISTKDGERHHEQYKNEIIIKNNFPDKKIGGYPRYVKINPTGKSSRQARHIPDKKEYPNIEIFPEVLLVDKFIDTFVTVKKNEEVADMKSQTDADGNTKWIPITPADSILYDEINKDSPYYNIYFNSPESMIMNIYKIALNRFYIGSQFTYEEKFFQQDPRAKALVEYVAAAEANNIVASVNNLSVLNSLKTASDIWKTQVDGFYDVLNKRNVIGYSSFDGDPTTTSLSLTNGTQIFRQRENSNFIGIKIIENDSTLNDITERTTTTETPTGNEITSYKSKDAVDKFMDGINQESWIELFSNFFTGGGDDISKITAFIKQNLPYFADAALDDNFDSDFILKGSFPDVWSKFLSKKNNGVQYDTRFKEILNNGEYSAQTKLFIIASNMTHTLGFLYNKFLNVKIVTSKFKFPAYVETPVFELIYMGGLVKYNTDSGFKAEVDKFFTEDIGVLYNNVSYGLSPITYEAPKVENLGEIDKSILEDYFDRKLTSSFYGQVEKYFINMIDDYYTQTDVEDDREDFYYASLRGNNKYSKEALSNLLNKRQGILNLSQLTFNDDNETNQFLPLTTLTGGTTILGKAVSALNVKSTIDSYFKAFFRTLSNNISLNLDKIQKEEVETQNMVSDDDIRTQTYYSFKSIADKWMPDNGNVTGYPFNTGGDGGDTLIDKFIFVDRGMNPIGSECIINIEPLIDAHNNYDISVFNVMARLLSVNNFEFFPIANFMAFTDTNWAESFKISEIVDQKAPPAFVCMYLGGTSTTLNGDDNAFDNDGITDLDSENGIDDIRQNADLDTTLPEVTNITNRFGKNNPFGRVSAFKVKYSEQNQSFFKNIKIDTREFPETNESLAILSKLAGDESTSSPVSKGQNLFNIYESRAYSANVEMLGDMMIQPTQYFQLENIPIFNGVYMILEVNHNFTANHATTNFSGTKILKYPNPFVTDFASSIALIGGTGNEYLGEAPAITDAYGNDGTIPSKYLPNNTQYTQKIK